MEQKTTTDENDELGIVSVNKRTGTRGTDGGETRVSGRGRVGDGDRFTHGHEPMARHSNSRSRERGAGGEGREQTGPSWTETGLRSGPGLSTSQRLLHNWQGKISRSLPPAWDDRARGGAGTRMRWEADASWKGNRWRKAIGNSTCESIRRGGDSRQYQSADRSSNPAPTGRGSRGCHYIGARSARHPSWI